MQAHLEHTPGVDIVDDDDVVEATPALSVSLVESFVRSTPVLVELGATSRILEGTQSRFGKGRRRRHVHAPPLDPDLAAGHGAHHGGE
jgi:hypothetical protein